MMRKIKSYLQTSSFPWQGDLLLLTAFYGSAFFLWLGRIGLIEPDEGRYAEIPREMLERFDFITPTLNYVAYFEKPPLHYWLTALAFKIFGLSEFAARFTGATAGLLTVLLVYSTTRAIWGRQEAVVSAAILGASTGFLVQSRINLTDMTLTFCLTAALCHFLLAATREQHKALHYYLFYVFCGLSVLAKGLIGIIFPAGIVTLYLTLGCNGYLLRELRLIRGSLLLLVVAAPWFVLASIKNPDFAQFFFIHEHFERFLTTTHGRYQPFWFFVPIFLLTMLPWSFYAARALVDGAKTRCQAQDPRFFLVIWGVFIFLFFSASHSKLIPYILPIFPPIAMLIGIMFVRLGEHKIMATLKLEHISLLVVLSIGAVGVVAYSQLPILAPLLIQLNLLPVGSSLLTKMTVLTPLAGWLLGLIFLGMAISVFWAVRRQSAVLLLIGLLSGSYSLEVVGQPHVLERIAIKKSSRELGEMAGRLLSKEGILASFGYEQSLPFYAKQRVVVIGSKGELTFGSNRGDQSAWFIDEARFLRLWQGERQMMVLLKQDELKRVAPLLRPAAIVLGQKYKKLLITNKSLQKLRKS